MQIKSISAGAVAVAFLLAGGAAIAVDKKIEARILVVDSHESIAQWVMDPKHRNRNLRKVSLGQKFFLPIVVTGLATTAFGQPGIVADMQFIGPAGKVIQDLKKCCTANSGDPHTPGLVVLNPVIDLTSEPGDPLGAYEVRATVTYEGQTASAKVKYVLQSAAVETPEAADEKPAAAVTTRNTRPKNDPHKDARACLNAGTSEAIIRCTQKYR